MRPKRNTVCQNCRSRKLACDGKQPACSQCTLRHMSCSGYRQKFVFVPAVFSATKEEAHSEDNTKKPLDNERDAIGISTSSQDQPTTSAQPALITGIVTQSDMNRYYELEHDIGFIVRHYAPSQSNAPAEFNPFHNQICGAWVEVLPLVSSSARGKEFFMSAIQTLAVALRYTALHNKSHQYKVLELYCSSLRHIGKELEEAHGVFQLEHCIAVMCLAAADTAIPAAGSDWKIHAKGVGDLMERLGPEPFSSGVLHTLFAGFRPLLLISSILTRQKTFLALQDWTTIPFNNRPVSFTQSLLNKAAKLPGLLQRYYELEDLLHASDLVTVEGLQDDFENVLIDLQEWDLLLESESSIPSIWTKSNSRPSSLPDEDSIWFPNSMTANSVIHSWAFEIVTRTHLNNIKEAIATAKSCDHQASMEHPIESDGDQSVLVLAGKICDSMSYFLEPETKLSGLGSTFFPFTTAMKVFESKQDHCYHQLSRCRQIVGRLASVGIHFSPP